VTKAAPPSPSFGFQPSFRAPARNLFLCDALLLFVIVRRVLKILSLGLFLGSS